MTERVIIDKILEGNQRLYTVLVDRYQEKVKNIISKIVTNGCDIEDLVSETFIRAYQHLDKYSDKYKFSTWVCTIAKNKSIDFKEKNCTKQLIYLDDFEYDFVGTSEEKPDENVLLTELQEKIDNALNKLDSKCVDMLKLHYYDGISTREISLKYNMSENSVRSHMFRGRQKLKKDKQLIKYVC